MASGRSIAGVFAAVVALATGGVMVAAAMQAGGAPPPRDPTRISVTKRPYDRAQLVKPTTLSEEEYQGRTVWLQRCAYCHDGVGNISYNTMGSWLGAETVQTLTEVAVRAIIAAGTERMPGFAYALQPKQVDDLLAFMKTIPASTKPTPDQLAGRLPGTGGGVAGARGGGPGAPPSND
jgi:mono/diheme cytochrome c family protein